MKHKMAFPIKILYTASILLCSMVIIQCYAPQKKVRWDYWFQSNERNRAGIDHSAWDFLLKKYVVTQESGGALVKYAEVTPQDKNILDIYLRTLTQYPITTYSRDEQLPYWINLYNALTWSTILKYYPVKSIKNISISPGTFSVGPWDKKAVIISNQVISLNDIVHKIIRPIWNDNRVHFVLTLASLGSPDIVPVAFTASNADTLLDNARIAYVNDSRGVRARTNGDMVLSSIFKWYLEDFAIDEVSLISFLLKYAEGELVQKLQGWDAENNAIKYRFAWKLNSSDS